MDKIQITKTVAKFVVGTGASGIVKAIIKNNVAEPENMIQKISLVAGTVGLAGVAVAATDKYTESTIDKIVDAFGQINKTESTDETPVESVN